MRERIKTYYHENKEDLKIYAGGLLIGAATTYYMLTRDMKGMAVSTGHLYEDDQGNAVFLVKQKNGTTTPLYHKPKK